MAVSKKKKKKPENKTVIQNKLQPTPGFKQQSSKFGELQKPLGGLPLPPTPTTVSDSASLGWAWNLLKVPRWHPL